MRALRSKLLYFYLLIFALIFFRGYLPMKQMQQKVEVAAESLTPAERNIAGFPPETTALHTSTLQTSTFQTSTESIEEGMEGLESDVNAPEQKAFGNKEKKGYTISEFNKLSADELMSFDGVGEVTARAIVALRAERGGFASFEELLDVKGIGEAKLKKILGAP